jgi:hypothetical protein
MFYCKFFDKLGPKWPFVLEEVFTPYIFQNQGAKGALNGKVNFEFLALSFSKN